MFALIVNVRTLINKCKTHKRNKMNYTILTDTEFFNQIRCIIMNIKNCHRPTMILLKE